jgi:N-methylhydantoinase B
MRSTKRIVRTDGSEEWLPAKCEGIKVKVGDILYYNTWGGGGWGDPLARDPALVAQDVARGLVTVEGARSYGVVVTDAGADSAATEALRAEMRAARGEITEIFNFGGSIEEIKARCAEETHLEPPVEPVFRRHA